MNITKKLHIKKKKDQIIITLPQDIERYNFSQIYQRIESFLSSNGDYIVLDMSHIFFLYSVLLSLIMRLREHTTNSRGKLLLINVSVECRKQLKEIKLDTLLTISDDHFSYTED